VTDSSQFFCFIDGEFKLVTEAQASDVQLEVADSWLVENGSARSLSAHFERFTKWVQALDSGCTEQLPAFFDAVVERIPSSGRWFPRIEFHGEAESPNHLFLRLREAPEQLGEVVLWTLPEPDPRLNPTVKGPDLSLGMQMRRNAIMHGADEAVILDAAGFVLEGALSSLVWWRDDVLFSSADSLPWLPSITREEVFAIATQMGFATRTESARPADLVGLEIWALSSLQGIRPVSSWINLGGPVGKPLHVDAFARRLKLLSTSLG
jgi:branched-subunit amino acid aminotransferase/4-amino-4-deoxychorismate lyase